MALTTRFFQRHGIPVATALAAGFIDTLSQTAIQISLFLLIYFGSDVDFGISLDPDELSGLATIALIALGVLVVAVLVVIFVPSVRRRVARTDAPHERRIRRSSVCRARCCTSFGGNLGSEILFAITLAIVTRAYGYELPLTEFILINTTVSLFSSVIPVPGGIGVTEAGLTMGAHRGRDPRRHGVRDRAVTPHDHVLPAPLLGLHLLPVADQAPVPVAGSVMVTAPRRSRRPTIR